MQLNLVDPSIPYNFQILAVFADFSFFKIISINKKLIKSKSEARRYIRGGAVKFNGKILNNELEDLTEKDLINNKIEISIGKKNNFVIKIN